jgi:hypothetical protein
VTPFGRIWRGGAALLALVLSVGAPAAAQDDQSREDALERLRRIVPEGQPTAYDVDDADAIFDQLAGLAVLIMTTAAGLERESRLTGPCGGFAYSYDEHGFLLDAAADLGDQAPPIDLLDGGQAFTADNPFEVDTGGVVLYYGFSPRDGEGPVGEHWRLKTSGGTVNDGGDPNLLGLNRSVGVIDVDHHVPFDFSARVKVDGDLTSENLTKCVGEGYVEFVGGGLISPIGIATLAVFVVGLVGLVVHARPTTRWKT